MPARVVVDDLHAIPRGVRNEHAPGLRIERAVIERRVMRVGYFDVPLTVKAMIVSAESV